MDIAVIVVNWNTRELLHNCLESIYKTISGVNYEVIVVDNASQDGSVAMLQARYPHVRIIQNKENRGFGAANNQAMRIMNGRYALLLNSDTVLTENAMSELFSFMERHQDAAMACGQLLNADGSKQNSVANFPSVLTLLLNTPVLEYLFPRCYPSKRYQHKDPIEVDSGIGACLLIRKRALDEVGFFDERFFFFFEETDLSLRMKKAGWKIFYVPSEMIFHFQGQSVGRNLQSRILFYRSRYQYFQKWFPGPYTVLIYIVILGRLMINWASTFLVNVITAGMFRNMRNKWIVYTQLLLWHFRGCP